MVQGQRRRNEALLRWLRASAIAVFTWFGMASMNVRPLWLGPLLALMVGGLMLVSADLGVLASLLCLSIPVIATEPLVGLVMLILGIAAVHYLAADGAAAYFVIMAAVAGAFFGPVWAAAALAGYFLGASEGALAATLACLVLETLGLILGMPGIGVTQTGGSQILVSFSAAPDSLVASGWVASAFSSIGTGSVNRLISGFSHVSQPVALLLQPAAWAAAAAVAALVKRSAGRSKSDLVRLAAVTAAVAVGAVGAVSAHVLANIQMPWNVWAWSTVSSFATAAAFVLVAERLFPAVVAVPASRVSVASEDADVDELLRLIATAEDKLAAQHTSQRTVLITDMKSFSQMTEEDGSVATAKAIQRHRDLLLPVVSKHGGHGKSTGGDGLVAAFENAADALRAATEMQAALASHNATHHNEREIWVRAGLASGEVVLDKSGRPFIGTGLNLAARIMNLADGGQILASGDVASAARAANVSVHFFGKFELKNIARPVEIAEVLWSEEQEPRDPRATHSAGD